MHPTGVGKVISVTPKAEELSSWAQDLGLMSHYSSVTSATLPGASRHVWRIHIPSLAVTYPYLMHQILAVSAFHLANLNPPQHQAHLSRALEHQHYAICGVKAEVSAVTEKNSHAVFAASSLLFIGAFAAHTPKKGGNLQQAVDDMLGLFCFIRGVGSVLDSFKQDIHDGVLGEFMECNSYTGGTDLLTLLLRRLHLIAESSCTDELDPAAEVLLKEAILG